MSLEALLVQDAEIERLRAETDRLKREWERECADGDAVLQALGIDAQDYRTDGGSLNLPKIRVHIHAREARLAEAEHLILRMAGEDYQRARFYVEKYDLTGERAAVSASAVQPERCCLDYPLCDCNSPPEPDDDWLCFQRPAQPKVTP